MRGNLSRYGGESHSQSLEVAVNWRLGDRELLRSVFFGLVVACLGMTNAHASLLYGTNSDGYLVQIDPITGVATQIGPNVGHTTVGLAYNPYTATMYTRSFGDLYSIDLATGVTSLIGSSGWGITGLTFDSTYTNLFSVDQNTGDFYKIDPLTGAATLVGNTGIYSPLDLSTNSLGQVFVGDFDGDVYSIDTATGASNLVASIGSVGLDAIAFDPNDNLYGVTIDGDFLINNILSGGVAIAAITDRDSIRGLVFVGSPVPLPPAVYLFGSALGLIGVMRRKVVS